MKMFKWLVAVLMSSFGRCRPPTRPPTSPLSVASLTALTSSRRLVSCRVLYGMLFVWCHKPCDADRWILGFVFLDAHLYLREMAYFHSGQKLQLFGNQSDRRRSKTACVNQGQYIRNHTRAKRLPTNREIPTYTLGGYTKCVIQL